MTKIAVFASGTGTNFEAIHQAIQKGEIEAEIALVVCDVPSAGVIQKARNAGIKTFTFNPKEYSQKSDYERVIVEVLKDNGVEFIALAGYMRILGDVMLNSYERRIVNIHPSLLPAFKGKDAIGQAIRYGVKVMGVSIHYVDNGMDSGEIIAQQSFTVSDDMRKDEIEAQVHAIEHVLYPATLAMLLNKKVGL